MTGLTQTGSTPTLAELHPDDGDVLVDLIRRVEWLESQDGQGYEPAIRFYKRIIKRINDGSP